MNDRKHRLPGDDEPEQRELNELLTGLIAPIEPAPERGKALRAEFLTRTARSVAAGQGLRTVRGRDGTWRDARPGVRFKPLWAGPHGRSVLIELMAGASLPSHRHRWVEEGIVLSGELSMGDLRLSPGDYHVSPAGSRHQPIVSRTGALAYLRGTSLGDMWSSMRELLGGLLPYQGAASQSIFAADASRWVDVVPGVMRADLWNDRSTVSRFYRLEPGAELPAHDHSGDEECMMIDGEVFLGDILLCRGDYHIASAGSRHGMVSSDVGALLFVRCPSADASP